MRVWKRDQEEEEWGFGDEGFETENCRSWVWGFGLEEGNQRVC